MANLSQIGGAMSAYLTANDQHWPYVEKLSSVKRHTPPWPTLPVVLEPYLAGDKEAFHCPADTRELAADSPLAKTSPSSTTWFATEGTSYEWLMGDSYGGKKVGDESLAKASGFGLGRADQPLLTEFDLFHKGDDEGALNTLNADLKPRTARPRRSASE
jgi:hypothetical protein